MITIGVDAHQQVRIAVALDDAGRPISTGRGSKASMAGKISTSGLQGKVSHANRGSKEQGKSVSVGP